jgi:uncharacterized protein YkwD
VRTVPPALGWALLAVLALAVAAFGLRPHGRAAESAVTTIVAPPAVEGGWTAYVASESVCPGGDDPAAPPRDQERTMVCLVNYARARRGLPAVATVQALLASAALKAREIDGCERFAHDPCGTGSGRVFDLVAYGAGSSGYTTGENIALISANAASPRRVLNGWLNSDSHRENLFRADWTEQGVALLAHSTVGDVADVNLWVSQFGYRRG